jgi:hypothetical protein
MILTSTSFTTLLTSVALLVMNLKDTPEQNNKAIRIISAINIVISIASMVVLSCFGIE